MKITSQGSVLTVSEIGELSASGVQIFRDQIRAAVQASHQTLDIDLSQTRFLDSSGLGAMISIQKTMSMQKGSVRLLKPTPPVLQILELTRMHKIFEIIQ